MQSKNSKFKQLALAAALTSALAAPAMAQTSVTVSGLVDAFAGSMRYAGDAGRTAGVNSGGLTTSWFGFKGTEDLGGGLKANFQLTSFFQADNGVQGRFPNDTLFSRDANVGLAGNFGEVSLGRGLAPNFLPMILFNPFGDSFNFSPLVLQHQVPLLNPNFSTRFASSVAGDTGWSNQIKYTTPSFGGLTANLHYQFGEAAGNNGKNNVGANVLYFNGPLSLTAFYHKVKVNNPLDTPTLQAAAGYAEQKAWFIGGGYDFGVAKLYATYDKTTHDVALEDKTASLGLSVPFGAGKILAGYAQTKRSAGAAPEVKRQTTTVGYDYALSKRTDVYAMLMNDKLTGFDAGNSFGLGIRHGF
ncbi:porin [Noviherbaspirillum autotrophicum]|uniref:Porin n=1 Tax=Noviherbaspirillum autotrophicum TaxID=709839 RepID=A0A0C1YSC5_9BURK|nr:porin [Noviherbaspirillum autotrophicum]KIF83612.1 porin [Noviherbaspirillum autotrophicum]